MTASETGRGVGGGSNTSVVHTSDQRNTKKGCILKLYMIRENRD